jgi:PhnB protein
VSTVSAAETRIAPWLAVSDGAKAVAFYKEAFGATEVDRLADGDRVVVAHLSIDGAAFWIQEDAASSPREGGVSSVRMIVTVDDPLAWFARALAAGATKVADVHDAHGWRTGRVTDPFGHDWELSKRLAES